MMKEDFKYKDEQDKSLGLAGMAIAMLASDAEENIRAISLQHGEESFELTGEFFFGGNPRMSAKFAWHELLRQYRIMLSLALGNVMCRHHAVGHPVPESILSEIHDYMVSEGDEWCALEDDEVDYLFDERTRYFDRLFAHPTVCLVARDFASALRHSRRMSTAEIIDNLRRLASL